ncbi:hypothetical protein, partial [Pantoea agglomerans]|uniref:hypothetical protein n=1 Tax=Enterobacter agglomerans TaxID=549 RepID=UPI003C7E8EF9
LNICASSIPIEGRNTCYDIMHMLLGEIDKCTFSPQFTHHAERIESKIVIGMAKMRTSHITEVE